MTTDDAHDWALARAGEGEAFGRIFDRHRDRVFRHGLRLVTVTADADDLVAITFLEAWRRRDSVRLVDGSVLPWLLVTATNVSRNLSRSARRYRALLARLPADPHTPDHAEFVDDGEASTALRRLSAADQQVLTLCVLEGMSERAAAHALGIPAGTVKSRLSRAKNRLASFLVHPALEGEPHA
ncbi:MAG TPA: sigma-70 family RNA polymerase sigma factor [Pseudolysinimonas sp.]|nr:sigma-70 family RNA polymerase sigma factor [Pseudolysinimonas sp.]